MATYSLLLIILCCHLLFTQAYWPPIPPGLPELQCETYDEKDHTCTAPTTIHSGFYWNTTETIVKFSTYGDIRDGTFCQIFIAAKTVVFKYSNIMSCDIYINATNLLIDHSSLSTTGSTLYGKGWTNSTDFGNSYAAFGGFCSNSQVLDFTYGNYDTPYASEAETYGSGGLNSRGGGKIVIIAESFSLTESTISSNGYPEAIADCLTTQENGGTGGYIYIQSDYIYPPKDSSSFEAKGGISCSKDTFGGSGGRIIINGPVTSRSTYVNGGQSDSSICNAGGSGTVYYPSANLLFISNNNNDSIATAPTTLESAPNVNLSIVSGAFVMPKNTSFNKLQASLTYKSVQVSNHAKFGCPDFTGTAYNFNLTTSSLSISDNSAIACNGELRFTVTDLSLTKTSSLSSSGSKIMLNASHSFYSNNSSRVIFNPTTTLQNSTIILQTQKADILSQSVFNASFIVINAESLNLEGSLVSTNQTCFNVNLPQRYLLNALDYRLQIDILQLYYQPSSTLENFMTNFITSQYTSYILVEKTLTLQNTLINAARIGIFAHDIALDNWTNITSDGLGCPSDLGPGHGIGILFTTNCGSTGGGYGGVGGIGSGIYVPSTACISQTAYGQSLYGNPNNPIDEGSGGASYSEAQGGSGGGVVVIGAMDSLKVDGKITANGLSPAVNPSGGYKGAGSGSGGSVQLFMNFLHGTGNISVGGGDSCDVCSGGEGGGGRVKLNYPAVFSGKNLFRESRLQHPTISASKGQRFNIIKTPDKMNASFFLAYDGSIVSTPCPPGYFGLFCEPCDINYYKSDFSNSECSQCLDITGSAESQIYAQTTYLCEYNCTFSYQDSGMLHCADNIVSYAFLIGTHYAFIFLISALALIIFSLIWAWQHERLSSSIIKNEKIIVDDPPVSGSKSPKAAAANNSPEPITFSKNHVQRIPLLGDNLPENRWFINMDLVNFKEISLIRESIDTLRKDINRDTMWKRWWIFTLRLLIVFNFSLYLFCAQHFRKKIHKRIQKDVNFANKELKDLCRTKGIPTYFIIFRTTFGMSYGYLDIFQEGINFIQDNCREPISIMLAGNGSFFSPYHLDRKDEIFEHFTDKWIELNFPKINDFEKLIFQDRVKEFVKKFNKEAKYIDYYSNFNELRNSIYRLNYYIKLSSLEFLQNFGIYFYLYGLEIPKYTVEESDTTQPFLQSPIRATFLTNQKARVLDDFIEKTQRIKHIENSDFKLCLLIKSTLDPAPEQEINPPKPEVFKDITESFRPEEKELESLNDLTSADDVLTLKEALFTKLDACINAEQYSIPKDLVTKYKGRKPNLNGKKYYKEPKKFFVKIKKIGQFFFRIKKNKLTKSQLYLITVPLIFFEFFFLWFKTVLFIDYKPDFGMIASLLIPFPFSPVLAPYFGIISIVSSSFRLTQYFMVFNLLSLANKMVDVIFAATIFNPDYLYLAMMIFSFMNSLFVQILSNYLADVQHK